MISTNEKAPRPTVAVIMTAYNSANFIAEAIESLISQSRSDWELIVIDDGSTDATAEIVAQIAARDARVRLYQQPNGGVSHARNLGLTKVSPGVPYVALLDSDDRYLPTSLEKLIDALDARADAVGVFGFAEYMDEAGDPVRPGQHPAEQSARRAVAGRGLVDVTPGADSTFADVSVQGGIWPAAVALHRFSVVIQAGGFDPSFSHQGDWELYLRMSRFGPFAMVTTQVAWYRRHSFNLTGNVVDSCYQQERVRRKAWTSSQNTPTQRRIVARGARRIQLADMKRTTVRLVDRVRQGAAKPAAAEAVSLALMTAVLVRPGPPPPSRRRVAWVRTEH